MKTLLLTFMVLSFSLTLYAQMHVTPIQPGTDVTAFGPGVVVDKPGQSKVLPDTDSRNKFFARFPAAEKEMKSWDELDKDLFWMHLKNSPVDSIVKRYPKLPKQSIQKMKGEIK